jgi:hypothetical protein
MGWTFRHIWLVKTKSSSFISDLLVVIHWFIFVYICVTGLNTAKFDDVCYFANKTFKCWTPLAPGSATQPPHTGSSGGAHDKIKTIVRTTSKICEATSFLNKCDIWLTGHAIRNCDKLADISWQMQSSQMLSYLVLLQTDSNRETRCLTFLCCHMLNSITHAATNIPDKKQQCLINKSHKTSREENIISYDKKFVLFYSIGDLS